MQDVCSFIVRNFLLLLLHVNCVYFFIGGSERNPRMPINHSLFTCQFQLELTCGKRNCFEL